MSATGTASFGPAPALILPGVQPAPRKGGCCAAVANFFRSLCWCRTIQFTETTPYIMKRVEVLNGSIAADEQQIEALKQRIESSKVEINSIEPLIYESVDVQKTNQYVIANILPVMKKDLEKLQKEVDRLQKLENNKQDLMKRALKYVEQQDRLKNQPPFGQRQFPSFPQFPFNQSTDMNAGADSDDDSNMVVDVERALMNHLFPFGDGNMKNAKWVNAGPGYAQAFMNGLIQGYSQKDQKYIYDNLSDKAKQILGIQPTSLQHHKRA